MSIEDTYDLQRNKRNTSKMFINMANTSWFDNVSKRSQIFMITSGFMYSITKYFIHLNQTFLSMSFDVFTKFSTALLKDNQMTPNIEIMFQQFYYIIDHMHTLPNDVKWSDNVLTTYFESEDIRNVLC